MSRRPSLPPIVGLACLAALSVTCFAGVLFRGEQFAYRDAGHYYYPLYLRVQQQWDAGLLPLWQPEENGGMPLLGNPTAAVLYPGKLIYAVLPYPWAARAYIIAHVLLAGFAAYALARGLAIGRAGSTLAGLSYAFGAPVLFLHSNVIYLVGASWMPLGFRAADRWVRRGSPWGPVELGVVLALMTLGGDAEAAYLTGLFALGYALAHGASGWARAHASWLVLAVAVAWVGIVLFLAWWWPALAPAPGWVNLGRWVRTGIWAIVLAGLALRAAGKLTRAVLPRATAARASGVVLAGVLGASLAGVQVIPALETSAMSYRGAGQSLFDPYAFSIEPWRAIELLWPNVTGRAMPENHSWVLALSPSRGQEFWTPSIYLGGLTILLALSAMGLRGGTPGRAWLTTVAVVALLASFGRFGGPLWMARQVPALQAVLGPPDVAGEAGHPEDAFGSVYGLMILGLPGFGAFRFPAKLMVPAILALAVLAGQGWDRLVRGERRRASLLAAVLIAVGMAAWIATVVREEALLDGWGRSASRLATLAGPLDPLGALADLRGGLVHGLIVVGIALGLAWLASRRPGLAGSTAMLVLTVDLALANAGLVWTAPQAVLDREPEALRLIREAEAAEPSDGPFRVHRMPPWYPSAFLDGRSEDRIAEIVAWERATLQPSHGVPFGLDYAFVPGVLEPYEFVWFFRPMLRPLDPSTAGDLGVPAGQPVLAYPRRSVDLWNARYFLLPADPGDWLDESRGIAAFLDRAERVHPDLDALRRSGGEAAVARWRAEQDWQLLRNEAAFPRAWVVHEARRIEPVDPGDPDALDRAMRRLLLQNDRTWHDPRRPVLDLRTTALIESDDPDALRGFVAPGASTSTERVRVVRHEPGRVELAVELHRPGVVILADTYDPGWRLTIDGQPSTILRANRMMRGAAVPAGRHRLVFRYEPWSVRLGFAASAAGLLFVAVLAVRAARLRA